MKNNIAVFAQQLLNVFQFSLPRHHNLWQSLLFNSSLASYNYR
ncbi:hypothetical protein [Alteromonas sp. 76-1]|nr:hypothetical protein [Alteromonas sp. 76-1]